MKPTRLLPFFQALTLIALVESSDRLLKVPRIYNALISSNEDLIPSQAYPAVAPVIQQSTGSVYLHTDTIEYRRNEQVNVEVDFQAPSVPELHPEPSNNIKTTNLPTPTYLMFLLLPSPFELGQGIILSDAVKFAQLIVEAKVEK